MRQLTYALWLKSTTDASTHTGLVNVMTAAFNGISYSNRRFTFADYPPELEADVQQLFTLVTDSGLQVDDSCFISLVEFGHVKTYIVNVHLPGYGHDSFTRFIVYGGEPVAQQFDFSGYDFITLSITVNSPEKLFLTGSGPALRNWDPFNAIPLSFIGERGGPFWTLSVPMIPGETLEYKLVDAYGQYEPGPNRTYTAGYSDDQIEIGSTPSADF